MGNLSKNLSRSEFVCSASCGCGFDTVDSHLVKVLQDVTDAFDAYIIITGGNRCRRHNRKLREDYDSSDGKRGAKTACNSQHIHGRAADFKLFGVSDRKQIDPDIVYNYLLSSYPDSLGLGLYSNRVHVDTRTGAKARWVA
jgi:uncharacterized protein YcbK (DUF882 family)